MFNYILAVELPKSSGGQFDWRPILSSVVLCIIAAIVSWWFNWMKGISKRDTNHFVAFMDESAEFREEVRKDRERLKDELSQLIAEKEHLKIRIIELERKQEECTKLVVKHSEELATAREENEILHTKIKTLKEALISLNPPD